MPHTKFHLSILLGLTACITAGSAWAQQDALGRLIEEKTSAGQHRPAASGVALPAGLGTGLAGTLAPGGALAGLGMPNLQGTPLSNMAGVLEYCVRQRLLEQTARVTGLRDGLLGRAGLARANAPTQDSHYASGLAGQLMGSGSSLDFGKLQKEFKAKACEYVLKHAASLL